MCLLFYFWGGISNLSFLIGVYLCRYFLGHLFQVLFSNICKNIIMPWCYFCALSCYFIVPKTYNSPTWWGTILFLICLVILNLVLIMVLLHMSLFDKIMMLFWRLVVGGLYILIVYSVLWHLLKFDQHFSCILSIW